MLERLRSKVANSRLGNVEVVHAGFLSYQHLGPPADFVYSRWALHHVPDLLEGYGAAPGQKHPSTPGDLRLSDVVYSFDRSEAEERLQQWAPHCRRAGEGPINFHSTWRACAGLVVTRTGRTRTAVRRSVAITRSYSSKSS